jgi:type I restriction enzyme M protein
MDDEPKNEDFTDLRIIKMYLELNAELSDLKKEIKEVDADLDKKAYNKYLTLTEDEIKTLVVDDKWLAVLEARIRGEMDRISQTLTRRVKELAKRYGTPMPEIEIEVSELEAKVNSHLERMGFSWE